MICNELIYHICQILDDDMEELLLLKGEDRMELKMPIVIMEFFKNTSFIYSLKILLVVLGIITIVLVII